MNLLATVASATGRGQIVLALGRIISLPLGLSLLLLWMPLQAQEFDSCAQLPDHATVRTTLQSVLDAGQLEGFGHAMWVALVDRDGGVCVVAHSGADRTDQWPGGRIAAVAKANTANAFSLPERALSTANLYRSMQPGGMFFGMQQSHAVDAARVYDGPVSEFGGPDDPMVGQRVGGILAVGGGLPLYNAEGQVVGGLGVSGDTSCTDHLVAWKIRDQFSLDHISTGVSATQDDNIVFDPDSIWSHPVCDAGVEERAAVLPVDNPVGEVLEDTFSAETQTTVSPTVTVAPLIPTPTPPTPLVSPTLLPTATQPASRTPIPSPTAVPAVDTPAVTASVLSPTLTATVPPTSTPDAPVSPEDATPQTPSTVSAGVSRFVPAGFTLHASTMLELSLFYPDGWLVSEEGSGSGLIVESVESCIDIVEQANANCGVILVLPLDPEPLALNTGVTAPLMQRIIGQFVEEADIVAGPTLRTINDQDAAVAEFEFQNDGVALPGLIALIVHEVGDEMRAVLLIGAVSLEAREPLLPLVEAVINSVLLAAPGTIVKPEGLPRPVPTVRLQPTPVPTPTR